MWRLKSFGRVDFFFDSCCFPFSFSDLPLAFSFPFPDLTAFITDPLFLADVAAFRRVRALTSLISSRVLKAEQVFFANFRSMKPRERVASVRYLKVVVVWRRSFAVACQVHKINKRSRMTVLCGSGRRCSNTGIEHYIE